MAATGIESNIAKALLDKVASYVGDPPSLPVAYQNPKTVFVPPEDGKYLEVTFIPNKTATRSLSRSGSDQHQGLLQISVHWPRNTGIIEPLNLVADIIDAFARDTVLTSNGVKVTISGTPWESTPMDAPQGTVIPITIPWRAFVRH